MKTEFLLLKIREYEELEKQMLLPETVSDTRKYKEMTKKYASMGPLIEKIKQYLRLLESVKENNEILATEKDPDMRTMVQEDIKKSRTAAETMENEIKILMIPPDPNEDKNILVEIRAGTGGEEAALFVADLHRMYKKYAESKGLSYEAMDFHPTELGGFKEIIFSIKGKSAYGFFKYEMGVHRVQRVPQTEASGRIHTSAVTVAVLPEAEDVDVDIDEKDLRIDIFHSSGAGGQNVNKVATAVRITHLPTNTVVVCQDERSQHKNKEKAFRILKARLYEKKLREHNEQISSARKTQVGSGDRSERIRTFNFPERRVTDHRINLTLYRLEAILDGELDMLVEPLKEAEHKELLEAMVEQF